MLPTDTEFEAKVSMETEAVPVPEDPPMYILFVGDFSGRGNFVGSGGTELPTSDPVEVDRDNFDDVLRSLGTSLRIDPGGEGSGTVVLKFTSLDDFHPDTIFAKVPLFSELRHLRTRLLDPDEFESAAREVRSWIAEDLPDATPSEPAAPPVPEIAGGEDLLDDILGSTKRDAASYSSQTTEKTPLTAFVGKLVRPYLLTTDEAEQEKLIGIVDRVTGDLMRGILHHPDFRELEAAWRGMYLVARGVETGQDLKLFILDLSKDELCDDLKGVSDLSDSAFFRVATRGGAGMDGEVPWAVICGNYNFALDVDDAAALIRLGKILNNIRAPFISHVRPQMLGVRSLADAPTPSQWNLRDATEEAKLWTMLRTIPEASSIGLAMPRFLTRLPYGADTDPMESFDFEEFPDGCGHDGYLWANPSFLCGFLLAQSFVQSGWEIGGRYVLDVKGLPTHIYKEEGEVRTKPCAETEMTHEACDVLIEQGIMPLITFKDTDRVRLGGFHSIAFPLKALNGRWS